MSITVTGTMYFDMPEHDINGVRCDVEFECTNDDFEEMEDKLAWDDIVKFYDPYALIVFNDLDIGGEKTFEEMEAAYGEAFKNSFNAGEFDFNLEKLREYAQDAVDDSYFESRRDY